MNVKKEKRQNKKIAAILIALGVFVIAGIASVIVFRMMMPQTFLKEAAVNHPQGPVFMFHDTAAPGWWSGGNISDSIDNYTGDQITKDDISVASMSVSQGKRNEPGNCFVSYYFWEKNIKPAEALVAMERRSIEGETNVSLSPLGQHKLKIDTYEGQKEYTLHQYEFTGSGSANRAKGAQFGYVSLNDGYIEMRSYCNKADQLKDTLIVLPAVSLEK